MNKSSSGRKALIEEGLINTILIYLTKKDLITFYHAFSLKGCPCRVCCRKGGKDLSLEREIDVLSDMLEMVKDLKTSIQTNSL